jgi:hypothetical protein
MTGRHSPALRLIALLLALLLPAGQLVDGAGLHHCPHHDAGLGVSLGEHHAHHGSSHDGQSHKHDGPCHCLGTGCASQLAILSGRTPVLAVRTAIAVASGYEEPQVVWPAASYRLPFAIGPPRSVPSSIA